MNRNAMLEVLLGQLALEDPVQFGDRPDTSAPLVQMICRVLDETLKTFGDDVDHVEGRLAVCGALTRAAAMLGHAASALWQSAYPKGPAPSVHPSFRLHRPNS